MFTKLCKVAAAAAAAFTGMDDIVHVVVVNALVRILFKPDMSISPIFPSLILVVVLAFPLVAMIMISCRARIRTKHGRRSTFLLLPLS
jgi:hypothetical protein